MIEYIKLFWEGALEGEPVVILYEIDTDHDRLALRSIDVFPDRRTKNAYLIDKADFEKVWKARCYDNELSAPDYK